MFFLLNMTWKNSIVDLEGWESAVNEIMHAESTSVILSDNRLVCPVEFIWLQFNIIMTNSLRSVFWARLSFPSLLLMLLCIALPARWVSLRQWLSAACIKWPLRWTTCTVRNWSTGTSNLKTFSFLIESAARSSCRTLAWLVERVRLWNE